MRAKISVIVVVVLVVVVVVVLLLLLLIVGGVETTVIPNEPDLCSKGLGLCATGTPYICQSIISSDNGVSKN